jgi:hypothetical protein
VAIEEWLQFASEQGLVVESILRTALEALAQITNASRALVAALNLGRLFNVQPGDPEGELTIPVRPENESPR